MEVVLFSKNTLQLQECVNDHIVANASRNAVLVKQSRSSRSDAPKLDQGKILSSGCGHGVSHRRCSKLYEMAQGDLESPS